MRHSKFAIELIKQNLVEYAMNNSSPKRVAGMAYEAAEVITQLQASQPKWIPVSKMKPPAWEIPPEIDMQRTENWPEYIVTISGAKVATILRYDFREDSWFTDDGTVYLVDAWMYPISAWRECDED